MDTVTGPAGPQGEEGPAGKNMVILGVVSTNSNLPQNANVGDAYTVINDVGGGEYVTYIWDGDSWESIGNIQGASGEGVAEGGADGDLLVKDSTDEFKTKWVAVNDTYDHETPSALASSAKAIKEGVVHVMDALHPAGSIYITDGENPYNLIDVGESTADWELIDKGFKSDVLTAN